MDFQALTILTLIGLAAGILSGLVGVGGGIILVPALVYFLGYDQHQAQGTSLGVLTLPVVILAFLTYYKDCFILPLKCSTGTTPSSDGSKICSRKCPVIRTIPTSSF